MQIPRQDLRGRLGGHLHVSHGEANQDWPNTVGSRGCKTDFQLLAFKLTLANRVLITAFVEVLWASFAQFAFWGPGCWARR